MKPSPLDLIHYFVTHASMSANPDYDEGKEIFLSQEDLRVDCDVRPPPETEASANPWVVRLNLRQNVNAEKNAPYNFAVQITGFFRVHPHWPHDAAILVRTNAPTLLFGACREIVRGLTAQGPFQALVLPSVSFYPGAAEKKPGASKPKPGRPAASTGSGLKVARRFRVKSKAADAE